MSTEIIINFYENALNIKITMNSVWRFPKHRNKSNKKHIKNKENLMEKKKCKYIKTDRFILKKIQIRNGENHFNQIQSM